MDITEVILHQHDEQRRMFAMLDEVRDDTETAAAIWDRLAIFLETHAEAEERFFYPHLLKKGTGATVASGDTVTVQYQGVNWRTGKVFDQSWGRAVAQFPTTGVVKGFATGMVGQTVGPQVVVVIPPADGYGSKGNSQAGIKGTDTLVFVIDILDVK